MPRSASVTSKDRSSTAAHATPGARSIDGASRTASFRYVTSSPTSNFGPPASSTVNEIERADEHPALAADVQVAPVDGHEPGHRQDHVEDASDVGLAVVLPRLRIEPRCVERGAEPEPEVRTEGCVARPADDAHEPQVPVCAAPAGPRDRLR